MSSNHLLPERTWHTKHRTCPHSHILCHWKKGLKNQTGFQNPKPSCMTNWLGGEPYNYLSFSGKYREECGCATTILFLSSLEMQVHYISEPRSYMLI